MQEPNPIAEHIRSVERQQVAVDKGADFEQN
jgi:hypothetical protein